jgi:AraC-like DNA-binding protein
MPLFLDIHFIGEISVENTRKAHLADIAVQKKYGVTYHQYWINEEAGTVYFLMEGPDKESCAATHREANGITACQILEVEGGMYDAVMDKNQKEDHGLAEHDDSEIDTGYRFILSLDIHANTLSKDLMDCDHLKLPRRSRNKALHIIEDCNGKIINTPSFDIIIAVFKNPEKVLRCAYDMQRELHKYQNEPTVEIDDISFNMGISVGKPVIENEGFFEEAIRMSQRLCFIAGENEIITSRLFAEFCDANEIIKKNMKLRILNLADQNFLDTLLDITENRFSEYEFGVERLSRDLGVSQPQLYRKVTAITGRSPVTFIRDIRLNKALSLIRENIYNISEIALEVGYNSSSYFSKCFQEKFGIKPSRIAG